MPFLGYEGAAGTGKTFQLLRAVISHCRDHPLLPHQKVLALTFMHGSRRRLDERLKAEPGLRGRAAAMTIDSFSRVVLSRWRSLAEFLGCRFDDFDQTCNACGQLLERPEVAVWVASTFPVIVVDEAQELSVQRLRVVSALAQHATLFVAADEFQCLDERLDTAPFRAWFEGGGVERLTQVHRTDRAGLLDAGVALRGLSTPREGPGLKISYHFPNAMPFAIGRHLVGLRGSTAILYPPGGAAWAEQLRDRLAEGLNSKGCRIPPLWITKEAQSKDEISAVMQLFGGAEIWPSRAVTEVLAAMQDGPRWLAQVQAALVSGLRCGTKSVWTPLELQQLMERKAAAYRAYMPERRSRTQIMSIHQAKNRQFKHVVILWPPGVPGADELQARFLYNGITRAEATCWVFVRTRDLLGRPPFRFA